MKTKCALLTGLVVFAVSAAFGQVEHDDMYFNSKDRAKLNASKQEVLVKQYKQEDLRAVSASPINPTDSYSGRSVNPEYTNRLKTNPNTSTGDGQYFVSGYQPIRVNQNLPSNNCNCGINNFNSYGAGYGGYGMNPYYGYGMNSGFGSPFNSFYSPWGMSNGFYQPGWSSMLGYGFGGINSGWFGSMNYGFGNSWGSPWNYGYGSSFYNSYGYGMPFGGYGSNYYGNNVIVVNGGDYRNPAVHGKRSTRSSDIDNVMDRSRPETTYTRNGREVANGRSRSENQTQYYDRAWKRDPDKNPSRSYWGDGSANSDNGSRSGWNNSNSNGRQNSSSDWGNNSRADWGNNSRGSFNSGGSSGGASRGGSSGGSSSGHSRGRN
jgi:hypothetical protein